MGEFEALAPALVTTPGPAVSPPPPPPLPVPATGREAGTTSLRDAYTNLLGRLVNQNVNPQVRDRAQARLGMDVGEVRAGIMGGVIV
jgi:hypothetical protein